MYIYIYDILDMSHSIICITRINYTYIYIYILHIIAYNSNSHNHSHHSAHCALQHGVTTAGDGRGNLQSSSGWICGPDEGQNGCGPLASSSLQYIHTRV